MENGRGSGGPLEAQERAVGITAYAAPNIPGFQCTIKHRYTDFLVNEILPNGQVLHLTELNSRTPGTSHTRDKPESASTSADLNGQQNRIPAVPGTSESGKRKDSDRSELADADPIPPQKKQKLDDQHDPDNAIPDVAKETNEGSAQVSKKDRLSAVISEVRDEDKKVLHDIFGEEVTSQILHLYAHVSIFPDRKPREHPMVKSDEISDKIKRTEAHVAIRRIFSSKLESATMQDMAGVMSIKAASTKTPSGARSRPAIGDDGAAQKGKLGWDELGGEYLHFTLCKENKDTMEVLFYIASRLKVPVKNFQFAGTKDRRAVTAQRVAIFRIYANRLAELNKTARGWKVGNFEYQKHGLELGELGGNEFLLTLRDCRFAGDGSFLHEQSKILAGKVLENATRSLQERGFINYYGLQRFGSFGIGTHVTGRKILSGDLEGAINTILDVSDELSLDDADALSNNKVPQDDIDRAQAIKLWRDGKGKDASRKMPKRFQAESAVIEFLGKRNRKTGELLHGYDWQNALTHIPRNLRLMYVHAYQSFVWNTVAAKRWEMFGHLVVEGDLVIVGEKDDAQVAAHDEVDEDGEAIFHPAADDSAPSAEDAHTRARPLSKAEAESGRYDIFDIVLPLPGFDVLYPVNAIGKVFEEFMASEAGGGIDPHKMRRSWKDISLSGAYRKLMARPGNDVQFEIKSYAADEDQMVETDLERIQQEVDTTTGAEETKTKSHGNGTLSKGKKIAIVLKLQLGSSQYATMALRELSKGGATNFKPDFSSR